MGARHRGGRRSACPKAHGIPAHRTAPGKGKAGSVIQGDQTGIYPLRAWVCKHPLPRTPLFISDYGPSGRNAFLLTSRPASTATSGSGATIGWLPPTAAGRPAEPGQEEHARRRPSTRGVRGFWSLGSGGAGRQPRVLRAVRPPAPRSGVGRHGRRRRPRRARLQGDGPGQPGVRRANPGHPPGAPGHRAHPLLDHRRVPLGERPAGLQDQRRRGRDRPGPQRQPHQHGRAGRARSAPAGRTATAPGPSGSRAATPT